MEEGSGTGVWARGGCLVLQCSYEVPLAYARPVLSKESTLGKKFLDLSALKQGNNNRKKPQSILNLSTSQTLNFTDPSIKAVSFSNSVSQSGQVVYQHVSHDAFNDVLYQTIPF